MYSGTLQAFDIYSARVEGMECCLPDEGGGCNPLTGQGMAEDRAC